MHLLFKRRHILDGGDLVKETTEAQKTGASFCNKNFWQSVIKILLGISTSPFLSS